MISKLKKAFEKETTVQIKGNQILYKGTKMVVPRQGDINKVAKFIEKNNGLTVEEMNNEIHRRYTPYTKQNPEWLMYVENNKYEGSYDEVISQCKRWKNNIVFIQVFVPYFGYITCANVSEPFTPEVYEKAIVELFKKTGILFSPKLSTIEYVRKSNHLFVKPVTLNEFLGLCSYYDVPINSNEDYNVLLEITKTQRATISNQRKEINDAQTKNFSLELELEKKDNCIRTLKEKNNDLVKAIDDIAAPEINKIEKERKKQSSKRNKYRHYVSEDRARKIGKKAGFYYPKMTKNGFIYTGKGILCDDPIQFLKAFNYYSQGYSPKEIYNMMPYFQKKYRNSSGVNNIIQEYKNDAYYHAIKFIVRNYGLDESYNALTRFKPVSVLV